MSKIIRVNVSGMKLAGLILFVIAVMARHCLPSQRRPASAQTVLGGDEGAMPPLRSPDCAQIRGVLVRKDVY